MATQNGVKDALIKTEHPKTLVGLIQSSVKELGKALPEHLNAERLVRIALTTIRLNPELSKCTPESFLGSLFVLAQLGLEPIAGRSYLLPFNNKRQINGEWKTIKEVQALVGYKGLVDLFYRHENALSIDMQTVYTNDDFSYEYGTNSYIRHRPALKERGEVIGYYAVAKMKGGASVFRFMSKSDIVEHAKKHSKSYDKNKNEFVNYSPWNKEFDAMAMKTVLIQLAKILPLSIEMQRAISVDETTREYRDGIDNALDLPDTTHWDTPEEKTEEKPESTEELSGEELAKLSQAQSEANNKKKSAKDIEFE